MNFTNLVEVVIIL